MVQISAADSYGKGASAKEPHVPGLGLAISRIVTCKVQVNTVSVHQIVIVTAKNRNITFLARARCFGRCIEDSNMALSACRSVLFQTIIL